MDPFLGSGSTGVAAVLEGFAFVGIEQSAEYAEIARKRIAHAERVAAGEAVPVARSDDTRGRPSCDTRDTGQLGLAIDSPNPDRAKS